MDEHTNPEAQGQSHGQSDSEDTSRMGQPDAEGDSTGGSGPGSEASRTSGSHLQRGDEQVSQADGDHLRERHPERVPRPEHVEAFREKIEAAFREGDPSAAWLVVQALLNWSGDLVVDAAKSRFTANFGTNQCQNCSGLKAGPGVAATCYQVKQCYYSNFRVDGLSPKQARMAELLGE